MILVWKLLAKKVETAEGVQMLAEAGIKYGQGYFYAKPTTDIEILKLQSVDPKIAKVTKIEDWRK